MSTLKAVRGTRDLLPPETALWNLVERTAREVFARYHFGEIRTPVFEDTQLFARGVGEETDIVSKEMYTWEDGERFDKDSLRSRWAMNNESRIVASTEVSGEFVALYASTRDGVEEAVAFASRADAKTIEELKTAEINPRQATYGLNKAAIQVRRLVVPAPTPGRAPEWHSKEFVVEYVFGSFVKSSQSLTLRPENTAGVVRAYIEHQMDKTGNLQKLYYIGPQFRRERPQKGRYRQFFQIGAEVIGPPTSGSESPLRDAEVLEMLATFLDELGIVGWTLTLNSVGSSADRPRYIAALKEALQPVKAGMCVDCQRRAETNPLRVLDCKVPEDQPIIEALPKIADFLDEDSKAHFAAVLAGLDACGVKYSINPRLVRGLDYYTRTTFEFTVETGLGTQNALLGGGRYDGLSEMLGGPKAPGIGFAIGEDRLILILQAQDAASIEKKIDVYIAPLSVAQNAGALALARELRRAGLTVEVGDGSFRLKKSFDLADKAARKVVLLGEDEAQSGILTVKDFSTGEQTKVPRAELATHLR